MKRKQYVFIKILGACLFVSAQGIILASSYDENVERSPSLGHKSSTESSPETKPKPHFPNNLECFLNEIPLLTKKAGVHLISKDFESTFYSHSQLGFDESSIVLGTGLKCLHAKSHGIPFDVLGFVTAAEFTRRAFGFRNIIHYIGDQHAQSCGFGVENFSSAEELTEEANQQKVFYQIMAKKLGIESTYRVVLASEFQQSPEYTDIKKSVFACDWLEQETSYTKLEVADIEYFRRHHGAKVKFSWVMHEEMGREAKRDECSYDRLYLRLFPEADMSFLYSKSGVNLSEKKIGVSLDVDAVPYSYPKDDVRITLRPKDTNAETKIRKFKALFEAGLPQKEEDSLKQTYMDGFAKILKRKLSGYKYPVDRLRARMDRISESNLSSLSSQTFNDMAVEDSEIPPRVLEARDTIIGQYMDERCRRIQAMRESFLPVSARATDKYKDVVNALKVISPSIENYIQAKAVSCLGEEIQEIIEFFAGEDSM